MIRNIVGSWVFAAFLVVVAVATWRFLDRTHANAEPTIVVVEAPLLPPPPPPGPPTPPLAPRDEPRQPPAVHTCGAGDGGYDVEPGPASDDPVEALDETESRVRFEDAVVALRAHDDKTGCDALDGIVRGSSSSMWRSKAAMLFAHRCTP